MQATAPVSIDPRQLFSEVVRLFNAADPHKSGEVSWQFHEHRRQQEDRWSGDYISGIISIESGSQAYGVFGEPTLTGYNPLALQVPWGVRKQIVGDSESSIDEFVGSSIKQALRSKEFISDHPDFSVGSNLFPFEASVSYVLPTPHRFGRIADGQDPHVIVSVRLKPSYRSFRGVFTGIFSAAMLSVTSEEMSRVANVLLTSKGVAIPYGCYGDAAGPLQQRLNEYVQGCVVPFLTER